MTSTPPPPLPSAGTNHTGRNIINRDKAAGIRGCDDSVQDPNEEGMLTEEVGKNDEETVEAEDRDDEREGGGGSNSAADDVVTLQTQHTDKDLAHMIDYLQHGTLPDDNKTCLLYTSPSPRDRQKSRMPSSA